MADAAEIRIDVSPGELIDKITILEIKAARFTDVEKLANVQRELALLQRAHAQTIAVSAEIERLTDELRRVNRQLWEIEDAIRVCEQQQDFGAKFIELARSVYHTNDIRAALKKQINEQLGSTIVEEKEYVDYGDDGAAH